MEQSVVECDGRKYSALRQTLGNLPLIVVKAKKGYVACSYIDKETAEKVGDVAAFVSGVKCMDDFLKAKIRTTTTWAEAGLASQVRPAKTARVRPRVRTDMCISPKCQAAGLLRHDDLRWT